LDRGKLISGPKHKMDKLPIIIEAVAWPFQIYGLALIGAVVWAFKTAKPVPTIRRAIRVVVLGSLAVAGASVAMMNINWRFRLDERGIELQAPLHPLRPGGGAAWSDIAAVEITYSHSRTSYSHTLHFHLKDRGEIALPLIDFLPPQFEPTLKSLLEVRAPQVQYIPNAGAFQSTLAGAHQQLGFLDYPLYRVKNGAGEVLQ
jgi:hypothetical protein